MRRTFADAYYWIALLNGKDQGHAAARGIAKTLRGAAIVTTDEVLTEVLAYFSERGRHLRHVASVFIENILKDSEIVVRPQSRASFLASLAFYKARPDKGYSQTDCVSMIAMREEGMSEILTRDEHFSQEGFVILL